MRRIMFFILICVGIAAAIIPGPQKPRFSGELRWVPAYTGTPQILLSWAGLKDTAQVKIFKNGLPLGVLPPGTKSYNDTDINAGVVYDYYLMVAKDTAKTTVSSYSEYRINNIRILEKWINYVLVGCDTVPGASNYEATILPSSEGSGTFVFSADVPVIRIPMSLGWDVDILKQGIAVRALVQDATGEIFWTRWSCWKESEPPNDFTLVQNYPNPFNPTTTIKYSLPQAETVKLTIYNILGQKVKVLVNAKHPAGDYNIVWDATDQNGKSVPTGVYLYQIEAGDFVQVKTMTLMK